MEFLEGVGLAAAAMAAGSVNAVAGGGSLISFPALVAVGYPAKTANVTNTVALAPGHVGGSVAYRYELGKQQRRIMVLGVPSLLGAIMGSILLLSTSEDTFDAVVPFLILFGTVAIAFQDRLAEMAADRGLSARHDTHVPVLLAVMVFMAAVYGAYFGAGLGVILLACFAILAPDDIQHSNALKVALSFVINGTAALYYVFFGPVAWAAAVIMMGGALIGGYFGVGIARALGRERLKRVVIATGIVVAVILLIT
jgi:hypothetical protein